MSGFVNPFAQIGDYRGSRSDAQDEPVTTGYLTGLPDPRTIADEQAAIIFRQMLKRDSRTKQRALGEFQTWLDGKSVGAEIEDEIHLAFIQMYAKLSLDISAPIRIKSHIVLSKLYTLLNKASSKYLKYSVGPWITSLHDPDEGAANAAKNALEQIFPGNKTNILIEKFHQSIQEYIFDACTNASAQSLSDERYVTREEASQKYTRLVKCCLDTLTSNPGLFDFKCWEVSQLVESGALWKFFSSADSSLARSALRLAQANIENLETQVPSIWKELLRAGRKNAGGQSVALEIVQLMNICTKRYPQETWPADESARKDSLASLGQFIAGGAPHPTRFWPLLYNLALTIPEPPQRDLTPLYKPIEKVVLKLRYNLELENSAWGCFVSMAAKMSAKHVQKTFKAAEMRCESPNVPVEAIAKYLARVSETEGVHEVVESQLRNQVPFEYVLVLAHTQAFSRYIEESVLPSASAKQIALLVKADKKIKVPQLEITPDPEWLDVAVESHSVDAQAIAEKLASEGLQMDILNAASSLYARGVSLSLDPFVTEHGQDPAVLISAVAAAGTLVSENAANSAFQKLLKNALDNEDHAPDFFRAVRGNPDFANRTAAKSEEVRHDIETLRAEDKQGVLQGLSSLEISRGVNEATVKENAESLDHLYLSNLDLMSLDLSVPAENVINVLRAPVPESEMSYTQGLSDCEDTSARLLSSLRDVVSRNTSNEPVATKLAVLTEFLKSWELVAPLAQKPYLPSLHKLLQELENIDLKVDFSQLWSLTESANYGVAYHAAMAIVAHGPAATSALGESFSYKREYYTTPTLKGALLSYYSKVEQNPQFDGLQRLLVREALSGKLKASEYMIIDQSAIPEDASIEINAMAEGEDAKRAVFQVATFGSHVSNLMEIVAGSVDPILEKAALLSTKSIESIDEIVEYVISLPQETSLDKKVAVKCLGLVNGFLKSHPDVVIDHETVQAFIERDDSIEINWIGVQTLKTASTNSLPDPSLYQASSSASSKLVFWLVVLNFMPQHEIEDKMLQEIFIWITDSMKQTRSLELSDGTIDLPDYPPKDLSSSNLALNALYNLCVAHPNTVREWYRDLRDKSLVKIVDQTLSSVIIPHILNSIRAQLSDSGAGSETQISVNVKQREIRASRDVEDEFTVDIVISLPEQYPGKPAVVNIRNLAGVSEAKKRGWLLEARQNIQNRGLLEALKCLLTRLDNFLEGIEPCAICYMTVNDLNKLPNKECSQCHNIYHSECLYKWFSTNGNKLCPMCRSPL